MKLKRTAICHIVFIISGYSISISQNNVDSSLPNLKNNNISTEALFDEVETFNNESRKIDAESKSEIRGKGIELQTRVNARCSKAMMLEKDVLEDLKDKCMEARKSIQDAVDNLN